MERENTKGKIALTVIGAATLLVALAGATFAYFSATSTTETKTITTSNLNLTVAANGAATHVSNIKPTKWTSVDAVASNEDIAVIPFKVTGTSSTNGTYVVNMQTDITLNPSTVVETQGGQAVGLKGGEVADVKYRLYKNGKEIIGETAFEAATNKDIVTNGVITANNALNDEYVLYVYIKDNDSDQNKLQGINFTITLGGSAVQAQQ